MSKQKTPTYLDPTLADKIQHEDQANAKRVINIDNVVGEYYSRAEVTYNSDGSATNSKFYQDTDQEISKIEFVSDVSGNLNNKYFLINSGLDETGYYVWYNVGNLGTDPEFNGKTGIEVAINTDEPASVVALATKLMVNAIASSDFISSSYSNVAIFETIQYGDTTDTADFNAGFTFETTKQGVSVLVLDYDIPQQDGIRYIYNELEKEFVPISTEISITSKVEISEHTTAHTEMMCMFNAILKELKKMNIILMEMSDIDLGE